MAHPDRIHQIRLALGADEIAALTIGDGTGRLAICLHGFPDTAWTWRFLLPRLHEAGYRPIAPFLPGFAPSAVRIGSETSVSYLAELVSAMRESLTDDASSVLIGHDIGALVAYELMEASAQDWSALVSAAAPPTRSTPLDLITWSQARRSWYVFFLQLPIASQLPANARFELVRELWRDWSPGYSADADLPHVEQAVASSESWQAVLGYYRDATTSMPPDWPAADPEAPLKGSSPLLYLHGRDDGCIGIDVVERTEALLPSSTEVRLFDGVGHFLHLESPDAVNAAIIDFLARHEA